MNFIKRIQYNAPVTLTFTLISFAVLITAHFAGEQVVYYLFSVYRAPVNDPLMYLRLFGHTLGHADINHFLGNFVIILLVGPMLEEKYGGKWLVVMMAVTALVTGLLFMLFSRPNSLMLGASGIVFMLMLLGSFTNFQKGKIPLTFLLALAVFLGREIISGVSATDNISHTTHIIGGICGALFGFIINRNIIYKEE